LEQRRHFLGRKDLIDNRTRLLRDLRRRWFARYRFVARDALVALVPDGSRIPPSVQALLEERRSFRIYPVEGGYLYKWPRTGAATPGEGFEVEAGGWDHEHCDACDRTIGDGGTAWLTERGSLYQLCPYCYRRLRQLGRT
jgi:hypothetical protein